MDRLAILRIAAGLALAGTIPAVGLAQEVAPPEQATGGCSCPIDPGALDARLANLEQWMRSTDARLTSTEEWIRGSAVFLQSVVDDQEALRARLLTFEEWLSRVETVVTRGAETHDGFLLRLSLGLGYCSRWVDQYDYYGGGSSSRQESYPAGGLAIDMGGSVTENFHLYFELLGNFPQMFAFGFGLGGYFADNWFFDAVVGYELLIGGYGALIVGKEWWVSPQWAMGVALRGTLEGGLTFSRDSIGTEWTLNWTSTFN